MDIELSDIATIFNNQSKKNVSGLVTGFSVDSRTVQEGDLFIPLIAQRDGHEFIADAISGGAIGHLYSHGEPQKNGIKVNDTMEALHTLACEARNKLGALTIGITGSVGKTTTKDMINECLSAVSTVTASKQSFNNEIGVPLTILSSLPETEYLVIEMGARGIGHIRTLCEIANPKIGVVTCIGIAHSEFFGGISQTIQAKGELVEHLGIDGLAVLNNDDDNVRDLRNRTSAEILTYGCGSGDVVAENITIGSDLKPSFTLRSPWGNSELNLNTTGAHNVTNALAAAATAMYTNVPISKVVEALETLEISPLRMETFKTAGGGLVINDSYNANPLSMKAALGALASSGRKELIAVLGVMAELGNEHESSHLEIGELAKSEGIDVISIKVEEYGGHIVETVDEAFQALTSMTNLGSDTAVLLKGSRIAALESLATKLSHKEQA